MRTIDPNGSALARVSTPALVLDAGAMDANIAHMAEKARRAGIFLRPHAKTHKSREIAGRQQAAGAIGICCATVSEAEALQHVGDAPLLITAPIASPDKAARLVRLHRRTALMVAVDHPLQLEMLGSAMNDADKPLDIVIDVDIGHGRTGVVDISCGVDLARRIAAVPRFRFAGLQGFAGQIQHIIDAQERREAATRANARLFEMKSRLEAQGLKPDIVTGSGTGTSSFDFEDGPFTELQVGSYIFMDADYGRLRDADGSSLPYRSALFVLATVVSVNRSGWVTVDAGTKALAFNGPPPRSFVGLPEGAIYSFAGDEHGIVRLPDGHAAPALGTRVLIGVTHCDPTVNLHSAYHVVLPGGQSERWPVTGRYDSALDG